MQMSRTVSAGQPFYLENTKQLEPLVLFRAESTMEVSSIARIFDGGGADCMFAVQAQQTQRALRGVEYSNKSAYF
jgi:hypothetical protein